MRKEDLIAFANRDWKAIAESKQRRWDALTPEQALQLGDALREHAKALNPDWPTPEDREADLEAHARVSEMLRRAGTRR
jgi:hypothetical protein